VLFRVPIEKKEKPSSRPYLLYVGNIKPHKNLSRLLEAFGLLRDKISHDLVLVGKKEGFITGDPEVTGAARKFGDRVRFTGMVGEDELKQYYAHAEALAFPSFTRDSAAALGSHGVRLPVAASAAASIPEVLFGCGSIFRPLDVSDIAQKIFRLIRDSKLRRELAKKGFARVREFPGKHL